MLQPKLNLRVSQRQVLTPGLVQMVSVLALNKLELKELINTELVENPVLEEVEESAVSIEEMAGREADRERSAEEIASEHERVGKDPFDEIDFGSYFQDYLDPGYRTASSFEEYDRPSFENFLSQPSTLSDHLEWQLGSMVLAPEVRMAADLVVGNLNEDGYLTATDEELVEALLEMHGPARAEPIPFERGLKGRPAWEERHSAKNAGLEAAGPARDRMSTAPATSASVQRPWRRCRRRARSSTISTRWGLARAICASAFWSRSPPIAARMRWCGSTLMRGRPLPLPGCHRTLRTPRRRRWTGMRGRFHTRLGMRPSMALRPAMQRRGTVRRAILRRAMGVATAMSSRLRRTSLPTTWPCCRRRTCAS